MQRRQFLKTSALASAGLALTTINSCSTEPGSKKTVKTEYSEGGSADLIIVGGGPAGISTAVTAARLGKKVLLFETGGCLGGVWTRCIMPCVMDFGRSEIAKEIIRRLDSYGGRVARWAKMTDRHFLFNHEDMKLVLEEMCVDAGVRFILNCPVVAAEMNGRNISAVFTESKSGRQRWTAKAYVDCSGDGDLAVRAGCGYDFGGENDGDNDQPASLQGLAIIDDDTKIAEFLKNDPSVFDKDGNPKYNVKEHFIEFAHKCGCEAPAPGLTKLHKNFLGIASGFEYGVNVGDAESITNAMVHSRKEMHDMVRCIAENGGENWKGFKLVATADQIGQRASRRIHGRYTITNEDIINGATFEDAVGRSESFIDIHATKKGEGYLVDPGIKSKAFEIPFRSCQAKDVDNLYMAGKCISGGFYAMGSYRVTGPMTEVGEGVAKKLCELI